MVNPRVTGCWDKTPTPRWSADIWADWGHREAQLGDSLWGNPSFKPQCKEFQFIHFNMNRLISLWYTKLSVWQNWIVEGNSSAPKDFCSVSRAPDKQSCFIYPNTLYGWYPYVTSSSILCSVPRWPHRFPPLSLEGIDLSRKRAPWSVQVLGTCKIKACLPHIQNITLKFRPKETKADRICLPWFSTWSPIVWDLEFVLTTGKDTRSMFSY